MQSCNLLSIYLLKNGYHGLGLIVTSFCTVVSLLILCLIKTQVLHNLLLAESQDIKKCIACALNTIFISYNESDDACFIKPLEIYEMLGVQKPGIFKHFYKRTEQDSNEFFLSLINSLHDVPSPPPHIFDGLMRKVIIFNICITPSETTENFCVSCFFFHKLITLIIIQISI